MTKKQIKKNLPIGIDNFEKIRRNNFYYVDKTDFIRDLMLNWKEVNLFTRPRRFGKTLNMSMLRSFLEIGCDKNLFEDLSISKEKELCEEHMGKYPVISVSFKTVNGLTYQEALDNLKYVIGTEALRFYFLSESQNLKPEEKEIYKALIRIDNGNFQMSDSVLQMSLCTLLILLEKHYKQKVILLIDEYDVPLDKAFHGGYYENMIVFMRNLLSAALKSNDYLKCAILTGCLKISGESIFTGLNNLQTYSVTSRQYDEYFGFTDYEVKEMLKYYNMSERFDLIKEWYDGYQFGKTSVYCPWDVIKYCDDLRANPDETPKAYWMNTSSNQIVKRFIQKADKKTKNELEILMDNRSIWRKINENLTYNELDANIDNLWSVLFITGYLTYEKKDSLERYQLKIPNKEIMEIFNQQIKVWFSELVIQDMSKLKEFIQAFQFGDTEKIENMFSGYLRKTISLKDTYVKKEKKENFYHGILLGLFAPVSFDWLIASNAESGDGYSDISIEIEDDGIGIIMEVKYAENGDFNKACKDALQQIEDRNYADRFIDNDDIRTIYKYGIGCYKKKCKVVLGDK